MDNQKTALQEFDELEKKVTALVPRIRKELVDSDSHLAGLWEELHREFEESGIERATTSQMMLDSNSDGATLIDEMKKVLDVQIEEATTELARANKKLTGLKELRGGKETARGPGKAEKMAAKLLKARADHIPRLQRMKIKMPKKTAAKIASQR